MKKKTIYRHAYQRPEVKTLDMGTETGTMKDIFSGGAPAEGITVDPNEDDSDDGNRAPSTSVWDD